MSNSLTTSASLFGQAPGLATSAEVPKLDKDAQKSPEAIREVAKQFESIFIHQVFKSMRATIPKDGLMESGFGGKVFTDMLDQQYADIASKNESLGLADMIAIQLGGGADPKQHDLRQMENVRRLGASKAYGSQNLQTEWLSPVDGEMSSTFGVNRDFRSAQKHVASGVYFNAEVGSSIRATRGGKVTHAGTLGDRGQSVVIDHGDGTESVYGHAGRVDVQLGQTLSAGETIGCVGAPQGGHDPRVYFEVRQGGRPVDPALILGAKEQN